MRRLFTLTSCGRTCILPLCGATPTRQKSDPTLAVRLGNVWYTPLFGCHRVLQGGLFDDKELTGYLGRNMLESEKSVHQYVVYDSDVERKFALEFEKHEEVKVFAKLPDWFRIDTPLGPYNPDWAVLIDRDGEEKLFFVVETKGGLFGESIRPTEKGRIECAEKHFAALGEEVEFFPAVTYEDVTQRF